MQSRQVTVPIISEIRDVVEASSTFDVTFAHRGGAQLSLAHPIIYIGPEGGWSPSEIADKPTVSLGSSVLRSETAAVAAASGLRLLRADLLDNHSP